MDDKQYLVILMLLFNILSYLAAGVFQTIWLVLGVASAVMVMLMLVAEWVLND